MKDFKKILKKFKTRIKIYSLSFILSMGIVSCGNVNSNNKTGDNILDNIEYTNFIDDCDNIISHYNNEEYYLSDNEIKKIIKESENNKKCKYKFDNDLNTIVNDIKDNSTEYINKNKDKDYSNVFDDTSIDLESILNNIISHATNDINEDLCRIKEIKIVAIEEYSNILGSYDEKNNILTLNYTTIKNEAIANRISFEEELNLVILHELNHARQWPCNCKNNDEKILMYDDNFHSMICESSAESELYNLNKVNILDSDKFIYEKERSSESLLFLIGMFNEKNVDNYYNAIFDNNLKEFFEFFNVQTNDEIKTLYNVTYSVDSYYRRTSLGDEVYGNNKSITYGDLVDNIGLTYRTDILKMTLKNMVQYTLTHDDFSLNENIVMFEYVKNILTSDLSFKVSDNDFVNDFYALNDYYINFLCEHYSTSEDVITSYAKENSKYILYNFEYLSNNESLLYDNYSDITMKLYNRFPLIKSITIPNDYYDNNYLCFNNSNPKTYVKK